MSARSGSRPPRAVVDREQETSRTARRETRRRTARDRAPRRSDRICAMLAGSRPASGAARMLRTRSCATDGSSPPRANTPASTSSPSCASPRTCSPGPGGQLDDVASQRCGLGERLDRTRVEAAARAAARARDSRRRRRADAARPGRHRGWRARARSVRRSLIVAAQRSVPRPLPSAPQPCRTARSSAPGPTRPRTVPRPGSRRY